MHEPAMATGTTPDPGAAFGHEIRKPAIAMSCHEPAARQVVYSKAGLFAVLYFKKLHACATPDTGPEPLWTLIVSAPNRADSFTVWQIDQTRDYNDKSKTEIES